MPPPYRTTIASRERNRVHAQKTRLRKKEQMQILQAKATELKEEQIRLKQVINEKNTASILVRLFEGNTSTDATLDDRPDDPAVEELLRRPLDDIPDASKIPELPALILPGQHASKKMKASAMAAHASEQSSNDSLDGIDYELLGRDRLSCSPEELDLIRRERNRMHAKRTRDRKRIFTEKLAELCRDLEEQNQVLHGHIQKLDPEYQVPLPTMSSTRKIVTTSSLSSSVSSPDMHPMPGNLEDLPTMRWNTLPHQSGPHSRERFDITNEHQTDHEHMILTLLKAAEQELHEVSDGASSGCDDEVQNPRKRQRIIASLS